MCRNSGTLCVIYIATGIKYHIHTKTVSDKRTCFKATVPLLLKKISEDLDYLKESLDIVRETPQYMANEFLCTALQAVNEYNIQKVGIL